MAATGGSTATGATPATSAPPIIAGLKFSPTLAYGEYFATDPNNSHFQIGYSPSTGDYTYSNPYTGVWAQGGSSILSAVQAYEQKYGNAPAQTISNLLAGIGVATPKTATKASTTATATPAASTSTATTTPDDVSELLAALPSLIGSNNADPSTQDTQQPEVLPTTSGGGTTAASPVIPLLLIGVAIALGFWWWKTHHKKHAAAE
jgi:hypothetical protein